MTGLERLMRGEEQVSDLIAFLADVDPAPLARVLGLEAGIYTVVREHLVRSPRTGERGRIDVLVQDADDRMVALLEVKVGAGQHGQQYELYDEWAAERGLSDSCWLVTLAGADPDAPDGWQTDVTLAQLVGAWRDSDHPHAAWLGGLAADVLGGREAQLHHRLGLADDPIVAALLVKQWKADLQRGPLLARTGARLWRGMRTNGGAPMLVVWVPVPGHEADMDVVMTLDLRAERTEVRPREWVLRLGIEVDPTADRTEAAARALAHDAATGIAERLTRTAFVESLPSELAHLSAALVSRGRGWRDGLAGRASQEALENWRQVALSGGKPGRHPQLFHDDGLRLASQLPVDATDLDRHDMRQLIEHALDYLSELAAGLKSAP